MMLSCMVIGCHMNRILTICTLFFGMLFASTATLAGDREVREESFVLPSDLMGLLQAEMREITIGVQKIPVAIAQADWQTLLQTGESIRSSYIMAKALNAEQAEALEAALPARFKQLDAEFHARAGALAEAARLRDPELASYHFSRLVEGCAGCHALYAKTRFPGFGPAAEQKHHH
jgi:hypothetical protein